VTDIYNGADWTERDNPPDSPAAQRTLCPLLTSALRSGRLRRPQSRCQDTAQTSRGKIDRLRRTPAGFTTAP
jgi:hypothetical protein